MTKSNDETRNARTACAPKQGRRDQRVHCNAAFVRKLHGAAERRLPPRRPPMPRSSGSDSGFSMEKLRMIRVWLAAGTSVGDSSSDVITI